MLSAILPFLFWFGLPAYIIWRMTEKYAAPAEWVSWAFLSWIGVYVVRRRARLVRQQADVEETHAVHEYLRRKREYEDS